MPKGLTPGMPRSPPPVIPNGLPAVMGLSKLGNMPALLPAVASRLAGNAMLPPRDKLGLAGMAALPPVPFMPIKEGNTALLAGLPELAYDPLRDLGESVSLHADTSLRHLCFFYTQEEAAKVINHDTNKMSNIACKHLTVSAAFLQSHMLTSKLSSVAHMISTILNNTGTC